VPDGPCLDQAFAVATTFARFFARTVNAAAEKLLVGQVSVNLVEVGKGVGKLLAKDAER